jgi:LacI family transcriptional regulator
MNKPARARRATMTDIAKLAGVSQSTVSLVINHLSGARVSRTTRDTVLRIARELGYPLERHRARRDSKPGRPGQGEARQSRNLIVFLTDELTTSPHAMQTMDGAKDGAWDQDCLMAVFATRGDPEQEQAVLARMLDHPALLGVIYSTIFTRAVSVPPLLHGVRTVLLNCHSRDRLHSSVVPAEQGGGYAATAHLLACGHRRIGFINGEGWIEAAGERLKGYKRALAEAGVAYDPSLVREGDWQVSSGYEHALALLGAAQRPSALFCANDLMAVGALDAARELKLAVPRDLSVMGYDDQDLARYTHPPLSTVLLPNYEMGRWAAETLIAEVRTGSGNIATLQSECPLVSRDSVGPPGH